MIALIQRVLDASVVIDNEIVAEIGPGLLALVGIEKTDSDQLVTRFSEKMLRYRVFADADDRMNLNVMQRDGGVLLVPQFTLAADTSKGLRPSFNGAPPEEASRLFNAVVTEVGAIYKKPETGRFGADMKVRSCNDGPVTFWLQTG